MSRGLILALALLAMAALGQTPGLDGTPPASGRSIAVYGRVTPPLWEDALGVYVQEWPVEIILRYGGEVYDHWSGKTNVQGCFEAELHCVPGREDGRVVVKVNGGLVYYDTEAEVEIGLEPALDLGVLRMQRRL